MTVATARPIRPGSREHRLIRRQEAQQTRQLIHEFEQLVADARLLARRDDGLIDQAIEAPRLAVLEALFGFIDGQTPLAELQAIASPLKREINRQPAQQMLRWLRSTLAV